MGRTVQQQRAAAGLCPQCGAEAAPYYLCSRCRLVRRLGRALDRAAKTGAVSVEGEGRTRRYYTGSGAVDNRWVTPLIPDPAKDRRFLPRLRGVPVDVEAEIIGLFRTIGRPCTVDEIVQAWGRLREQRKRGSITGDLRALIEAQQRRDRRAAKRLAHVAPCPSPDAPTLFPSHDSTGAR